MGLPYYQHNLAPFVAEPFHFSLKSTAQGGLPDGVAQQDYGIYLREHATVHELEGGVERWMKHYNTWRPHAALENKTPVEVYRPKRKTGITPREIKKAA